MARPLEVKDILPLVPHRPPMVWVDELISFSATEGSCRVHMHKEGLFLGPEGLRASSCLEFIAQAYGFCSMAHKRTQDPATKPFKRAFLASFKDARFASDQRMREVKVGDDIIVKYWGVRHLGSITVISGEARHRDDVICSAQMKIFTER